MIRAHAPYVRNLEMLVHGAPLRVANRPIQALLHPSLRAPASLPRKRIAHHAEVTEITVLQRRIEAINEVLRVMMDPSLFCLVHNVIEVANHNPR